MKLILQCLFSPKLYKVYNNTEGFYQPLGVERFGTKILSSLNTLWNFGIYTSPFICMYLYKQGYPPNLENVKFLSYCIGSLGCIIAISYITRAIGRSWNPQYVEFIKTLNGPSPNIKSYLTEIRKYDFEFSAWPVSYSILDKASSTKAYTAKPSTVENLPIHKRIPIKVLALFAIHTFGLRLIYPGTLGLIHYLLGSALLQGRSELVEVYNGQRSKIETAEANHIDVMFVDQRKNNSKRNILVICCEGNSGFYEVGIMTTPIKAGYSALGWNHPGFATSTGTPFPDQECNAIDAVMQFAINELGFDPENIVLFGWSIGGYTATWAAVNYPDVKGLVLDAAFDDLLPLAQNQMPRSWAALVQEVIRVYVDLNVGELLTKYPGPVQLVRRTEDEIICLRPGQLSSNCGNDLVQRVIQSRHPQTDAAVIRKYLPLLDSQRNALLTTTALAHHDDPLRLINKYMSDYKSSHCTPLPRDDFENIMKNMLYEKNE